MCLDPHLNWGWGWRRWAGLSPPVKYFTDRSKAVLLLWIFCVFVLSCVCYVLCASVYMCFVVTCWERADLLALVCGVFCEFVTFPLVSLWYTEDTTNESQEASPFPAGDHEAHTNRRAQNIANTRQNKNIKDPQKKYRLGTVSKIFYWRALTGLTAPTSPLIQMWIKTHRYLDT